jgi:3-dehydroquinate dehydratase
MCERCNLIDRRIDQFKKLVVQFADIDEDFIERLVREIATLRKAKAALHPEDD